MDLQTSKVLGLFNEAINTGTEAVFEAAKPEKDSTQEWSRHQENDGYFMLENKKSGYFLTAESSSKLTITGRKKTEKYFYKF